MPLFIYFILQNNKLCTGTMVVILYKGGVNRLADMAEYLHQLMVLPGEIYT